MGRLAPVSLHVERLGETGPRAVLVHGSVSPGWATWSAQRPLADRYRLVLPIRSGYPPNPPLASVDFDVQADELAALLQPGDHVVGHSYGAVIGLLAAARATVRLGSLTVIEPPAFGLVAELPEARRLIDEMSRFFEAPHPAREFMVGFLALVGSGAKVPDLLSPALEQSVRATMVERPPWEAVFPFQALRHLALPTLVVSGAHDPVYDAVCDRVEEELGARRVVLAGAGHSVPRLGPPFNDALEAFIGPLEPRAGLAGAAAP
jgi:pimeloyl-ACP methyl ester carboxylesterase